MCNVFKCKLQNSFVYIQVLSVGLSKMETKVGITEIHISYQILNNFTLICIENLIYNVIVNNCGFSNVKHCKRVKCYCYFH